MISNRLAQYKQVEVSTNDPLKLIVMLYDGAIVALKKGKEHIKQKEFEQKCKQLMKAYDIIFELLSSLDKERGGEVAKSLESMYLYMLKRIMEANTDLNLETIDEVITHLDSLNQSWRQLAKTKGVELPKSNSNAVIGA